MQSYKKIFVLLITLPFASSIQLLDEFLRDFKVNHSHGWEVNSCPPDLFITAVKVKLTAINDTNSVNAQITCSDEMDSTRTKTVLVGRQTGHWDVVKRCQSGFVVGIGRLYGGSDKSSIDKLQVYCSDEIPSDGVGSEVRYGPADFCGADNAMVGITEPGMTNQMAISCRPVKSPSITHAIEYVWVERHGMTCNETSELSKSIANNSDTISCSYKTWTGIGLNSNHRRAEHARTVYNSMGVSNNKVFVKWALFRRVTNKDGRKLFLEKFPNLTKVLDEFEQMPLSGVKDYEGSLSYNVKRDSVPRNIFKTVPSVLKFDFFYKQFVGNCAMFQIAFPYVKADYHVFIETLISKRTTRVVFVEFDVKDMKKNNKTK